MGWYNNVIAVDPRDPDRVWAAGVDWFRSDDGGTELGLASWGGAGWPRTPTSISTASPFTRITTATAIRSRSSATTAASFARRNARAATSGPRAVCTGGAPIQVAWTSLNRGYGVTQFYHGTPLPKGTQYLAGAQDNGTIFGSDAFGPDGWRPVFGGDGGFSAVHPVQFITWLVEFQWASLGRTTNGGGAFTRPLRGSTRSVTMCSDPKPTICSSRRSRTIRTPIESGWAANSSIAGRRSACHGRKSAPRDAGRAAASARSPSPPAQHAPLSSGTRRGRHRRDTDDADADRRRQHFTGTRRAAVG